MVNRIRREGLKLKEALAVVKMPKSTYTYRPIGRRPSRPLDPELCQAIRAILEAAPVYGYRKVTAVLRRRGRRDNSKKVLRHLRAMGLLQPRKRKGQRWTRPLVVHPSISNTYWEMDLTYVWCGIQQGYLFPVIDAYDRGIPSYCFGGRCRALEAAEALEMAVLSRFKGRVPEGHALIVRVDRGPQFTSGCFREAARVLGVQLEYAGIQCPDDKPYIESFIGKYKTEEVYRNEYFGLAQALQGWKSYRTWYETERLNQALGYRTPKQVLRDSKTFRTRDYNLSRAHFGPK